MLNLIYTLNGNRHVRIESPWLKMDMLILFEEKCSLVDYKCKQCVCTTNFIWHSAFNPKCPVTFLETEWMSFDIYILLLFFPF